jgi:hypothetical protein
MSFISLIQRITSFSTSTLLLSSNVWLGILSVFFFHASRTEFWMLFLSLPFGAMCPAHYIFNDKPSDLAVQEGLDCVDLRWGYRMKSRRPPSKSSSICHTSPCSRILHTQRLLLMIFGSGMLFGLVIWTIVRWRRIQKQAERKNTIESSSQPSFGLNIVIKIKPPVWQSG